MREKTGAELLIETLIDLGTDTVFGIPGNNVLELYEALKMRQGQLRHVLTSHEQGACFAADGYARATGKTGVVIATSGPGATNLVTGIAAACMDSVPLVAITGNVPLSTLGRDGFQEVDITGITMPVTKYNYIVKDVREIPAVLRDAFFLAGNGRKGPVLVDVPRDILQAPCRELLPDRVRRLPRERADYSAAVRLIGSHTRPLLLVGGGARGCSQAGLTAFAERTGAAVFCTMMGISAYPAAHPQYLGMAGADNPGFSAALKSCDLLIALGCRFTDRMLRDLRIGCPVLHLDIDPAETDKNLDADLSLTGDCGAMLERLLPLLPRRETPEAFSGQLKEHSLRPSRTLQEEILARFNRIKGDMTVVTDVGFHQLQAARFLAFDRPNSFLTNGGLGAMGYGLGAAIGASLGRRERVCLITGDGGFLMNLNEIPTAVKYGADLMILLFVNNSLGLVEKLQRHTHDRIPYQTDLAKVDYAKVAKSLGAEVLTINRRSQIEPALQRARSACGVTVVVCNVAAPR